MADDSDNKADQLIGPISITKEEREKIGLEFYCMNWQKSAAWFSTVDMLKGAADKLLAYYEAECCRLNDQIISAGSRNKVGDETKIHEDIKWNRDIDLYAPYMLLMGYAIEDIIKGIIVCTSGIRDPTFKGISDFNKFETRNRHSHKPFNINTHSINKLLGSIDINEKLFDKDEMKVLRYLEKIVTWGGRYPVGNTYDCRNPIDLPSVEPPFIKGTKLLPIPAVNSIYDKALAEMRRVCKQYRDNQH